MYLFSKQREGFTQFRRNATLFYLTKILNKYKNFKSMCSNENKTFTIDEITKWNDQMQSLLMNVPAGVSIINVYSSAINANLGLFNTYCQGDRRELIKMLVRLLDNTEEVHQLFYDSRLIHNSTPYPGLKTFIEAFKKNFNSQDKL